MEAQTNPYSNPVGSASTQSETRVIQNHPTTMAYVRGDEHTVVKYENLAPASVASLGVNDQRVGNNPSTFDISHTKNFPLTQQICC